MDSKTVYVRTLDERFPFLKVFLSPIGEGVTCISFPLSGEMDLVQKEWDQIELQGVYPEDPMHNTIDEIMKKCRDWCNAKRTARPRKYKNLQVSYAPIYVCPRQSNEDVVQKLEKLVLQARSHKAFRIEELKKAIASGKYICGSLRHYAEPAMLAEHFISWDTRYNVYSEILRQKQEKDYDLGLLEAEMEAAVESITNRMICHRPWDANSTSPMSNRCEISEAKALCELHSHYLMLLQFVREAREEMERPRF